jgi:hypothetical protein
MLTRPLSRSRRTTTIASVRVGSVSEGRASVPSSRIFSVAWRRLGVASTLVSAGEIPTLGTPAAAVSGWGWASLADWLAAGGIWAAALDREESVGNEITAGVTIIESISSRACRHS